MNFSFVILTAAFLTLSTTVFAEEMNLDTAIKIIEYPTQEYFNCEFDQDCLIVAGRCNQPISINKSKAKIYQEASKLLSTADSCEAKTNLPLLRAFCNERRIHCDSEMNEKGPLCREKMCQLWTPYTE